MIYLVSNDNERDEEQAVQGTPVGVGISYPPAVVNVLRVVELSLQCVVILIRESCSCVP